NEQFLTYWIELFDQSDFAPIDLFRARVWSDDSVHWWLQQNLVLFAQRSALAKNPKLLAESQVSRPIDVVHPKVYASRMADAVQAHRHAAMLHDVIERGGKFQVIHTPRGPAIQPLP